MQNFQVKEYNDPRDNQEAVSKWSYDIGAKVAYIKDLSSGALSLSVRTV